ncbi:MAG: metal-dependent hydrolase, partial [Vicinamibacteria bacterium]
WTHSLLTATLWGVLFAAVAFLALRRWRAAVVLGALVLSHWVLDAVTHRPDLPLWPGSAAEVGFGLWNSIPATIVIETLLFAAGVAIYLRSTRHRDRTGLWALWGLVAFLAVIYAANLFGPPPPSVAAIAGAGHAIWLLVAWGYWLDRHRVPRTT